VDTRLSSSNTTGNGNTATGVGALFGYPGPPHAGSGNTADGINALYSNTEGMNNTAEGNSALYSNTTGNGNVATGLNALFNNSTGYGNTAVGRNALANNTTGFYNTSLGVGAGRTIVAGSYDIDIGAPGIGDESNTIRIGDNSTQNTTYIGGISATGVTGTVVEVSSDGQLGVTLSSARYKRDIRDIGSASVGLMKLRPVTFRYKNDPSGTLQYGLVAEEVSRVYPELVTRGADGKVQSVRYQEFTALLLNELQKQTKQARKLAQLLENRDRQLAAQQRKIDALERTTLKINSLSERLAVVEQQQARTANAEVLRSLASK
jgi:hypothetical protein